MTRVLTNSISFPLSLDPFHAQCSSARAPCPLSKDLASCLMPHASCLLPPASCLLPLASCPVPRTPCRVCFCSVPCAPFVAVKCFAKIICLIFTLQIPSMQTSLIMGLMLHRVPSLTLPRGVIKLPLRHIKMQGSEGEIITSIGNCNTSGPSRIILWVNLHIHFFEDK